MIYRPYGKTGIDVSAIGFGGMRFEDQDDTDGCAALVKAAYDSGITYFDTAPGYGKSEDLFGAAFQEMNKTRSEQPFYVATKTNKSKPSDIRRELETSLKRMHLDHIDFYHMWCILTLDMYESRKRQEALKEFERLRDEGLVRHICVSTHLIGDDIGTLLADYPFEGILLGYSVMNFAHREAGLNAAAHRDRGVVVMNPLGGGMIPQNPDRFDFVRTRKDESVTEGALRFLLNDDRITVALVGFSNTDQLKEAVNAVEGYQPIDAETIERIRSSLDDAFNELCTSCQYCEPCPEGVPVSKLMDAYNHYMLTGKIKSMVDRLRWHWGIQPNDDIIRACIECGLCEEACTQKLPITDRIKDIQKAVDEYSKEQEA
jgi:hypothetical protein